VEFRAGCKTLSYVAELEDVKAPVRLQSHLGVQRVNASGFPYSSWTAKLGTG